VFKAARNQSTHATTQNSLYRQQVGFGILRGIGFDDAGPAATDGGTIRQAGFPSALQVGVRVYREQARHVRALVYSRARCRRPWGPMITSDTGFWFDQAEVNVQGRGRMRSQRPRGCCRERIFCRFRPCNCSGM